MSNYFADQPTRRSGRQPKKSLRKRESEGDQTLLPLVDSARASPCLSDANIIVAGTNGLNRAANDQTRLSHTTKVDKMPPKSTARGGVPGGGTPKTPENAKVKARSKKITKIPASNGAPPAYPKPKRKYVKKVKVIEPEYVEEVDCEPEYLPYNLPPFTRDTFMIYPWPYHRPDNILHLASSLRDWKMTQDLKEGCADIDDGSDDWDKFSGNVLHYPSEASLHTAIARAFVNRAKRAFRAYKTWEEFVAEESDAGPCRSALDEKMKKRRDRALGDVLDNNLRIAVFDKIAERLCNEIWLQEYSAETTGRLRLEQYPNGISPAQMSTADLEADLKQIRRLQHDNQHREKGGNIGMTGLETVLWTLGAGSDDEGE